MNNNNFNNNSESISRVINNLIRAELHTTREGEILWRVFRQTGDTVTDDFYFRDAIKAMRYVKILKRQGGGYMPAKDFTALCGAMKATPKSCYNITATAADGAECSTIVDARLGADAMKIGRARIARLWGPEAQEMKYRLSLAIMPEPAKGEQKKTRRARRSSKKNATV